ncbi:MAG: D-alanine--D-alanine ligase [Alphaproteobacteria bacterium]|nr:D-alanine--D-alanine ligase [Alphaproteobacteria bacterium]
MRILVLHSDVSADAPAEDQDTIIAARAVSGALQSRGHAAPLAPFKPDETALRAVIRAEKPDVVFNLVEGIEGKGALAHVAPTLLERIGVPYTGTGADPLILTCDKPRTKRALRQSGLPTPDWAEGPDWTGLSAGRWIVKSADEDASVGLDDASVVDASGVVARAVLSAERFGGRWFAECYVDGREFNIAVLEENHGPRVLPMAEMTFEEWPRHRPRIVGYIAKWDDTSFESTRTVRQFGVERREPVLAHVLRGLAERAWQLFDLRGTARVDFRVDGTGQALILEINPNPGIAPDAGFAAAAQCAGLSYPELIEKIVLEAMR